MSSSRHHLLSFSLFSWAGQGLPGYEKVLGKLSDRIIVGVRGADLQAARSRHVRPGERSSVPALSKHEVEH